MLITERFAVASEVNATLKVFEKAGPAWPRVFTICSAVVPALRNSVFNEIKEIPLSVVALCKAFYKMFACLVASTISFLRPELAGILNAASISLAIACNYGPIALCKLLLSVTRKPTSKMIAKGTPPFQESN